MGALRHSETHPCYLKKRRVFCKNRLRKEARKALSPWASSTEAPYKLLSRQALQRRVEHSGCVARWLLVLSVMDAPRTFFFLIFTVKTLGLHKSVGAPRTERVELSASASLSPQRFVHCTVGFPTRPGSPVRDFL